MNAKPPWEVRGEMSPKTVRGEVGADIPDELDLADGGGGGGGARCVSFGADVVRTTGALGDGV